MKTDSSPPIKVREGAPRIVGRRNGRGFTLHLVKPGPDENLQRLERLRKLFIAAVKRGDLVEVRFRIGQVRGAIQQAASTLDELSSFDIQACYRDDDGTDAIVLASANQDDRMVQLLRRQFVGFSPDADPILYSLSLRDKPR